MMVSGSEGHPEVYPHGAYLQACFDAMETLVK
jgi:hypothetical protein